MSDRWLCEECRHVCDADDILRAPNPFDPEDTLHFCPDCKQPNQLTRTCWKCDKPASSGTPTKTHGYVWACHEHAPANGE
jgi:hypothetical protein